MTPLPSPRALNRDVSKIAGSEAVTERRMRRWVAAIALIEVLNVARSRGSFPTFLVKGGFKTTWMGRYIR
jgi:hypothetical protein